MLDFTKTNSFTVQNEPEPEPKTHTSQSAMLKTYITDNTQHTYDLMFYFYLLKWNIYPQNTLDLKNLVKNEEM